MSDKALTYEISLWTRIKRRTLWLIFRPIIQLFFKIDFTGIENIPPKGEGYMIAYNHMSILEPPFVLAMWPYLPEAVAGHNVWERTEGMLVDFYGAIPIKRGEYDRKVMDVMKAVLDSGRALAIAPEGGRSRQTGLLRAKAGVAYMLDRVGMPIVPVAFEGTFFGDTLKRALKLQRPSVKMKIGKPFMLPPIEGKGAERRESRQRNADAVMLKIAAMLPEEYHGAYEGMLD